MNLVKKTIEWIREGNNPEGFYLLLLFKVYACAPELYNVLGEGGMCVCTKVPVLRPEDNFVRLILSFYL